MKIKINNNGYWFKPKDIIAIIVVIGFFILKAMGKNGFIELIFAGLMGYYFTKRMEGKDNGR